ncbi:MAG: UPF0149 family protein [Pseudomonadota bacterium]|nr:UPF0149 family protein [Pseudomonadota bacterium]
MTEPANTTDPASTPDDGAFDAASIETLTTLEELLQDMRQRNPDVPQWEFCEGFLTALLCTRRDIPADEWLPFVLGPAEPAADKALGPFASERERTQFLMHWQARAAQLRRALDARTRDLAHPHALQPAMLDWRGMALSPEALADADADGASPGDAHAPAQPGDMPAYGQMWAMGFLAVLDLWPDDWAPPRDKALRDDMGDALECIALLCDDDTAPPAVNAFDENAPPSISQQRLNDVGEAIWATYDLYHLARSLGPRQPPVRRAHQAGRNDPCPCGSGKKYKKCCGQ